jgi:argininosuccinate lyase
MKFAPEYVFCVLSENFEDAKAQLLLPLLSIHYAHLVMLAERGILSRGDARAIRDGLDRIVPDEVRAAKYDGSCEDLFFYVERLLAGHCGEDVAGRLHTARSRNDIDMTMYRMVQRKLLLDLAGGALDLRETLLTLAAACREDVFAVHTHTQPAQPTTVAHYLLAVVEQLERDAVRLRAAYLSTNQNPLGACAITGTGFPIDRERTTQLLGFAAPTGNTYGSIATVDYLLESVTATAVMLAGLGRVVQDLLLWCTREFGYLRLSDRFVQSSSIMPQKRNPVALEHARALSSKALGQASAVLLAVHNTPFGDIVDTEDDLQPLVASAFKDATRAVRLVAASMADASFDRDKLAERAEQGWITVTELADSLTRDHGVSFKGSHAIAARFVEGCIRDPHADRIDVLREAALAVVGRAIELNADDLNRILSARNFVNVRRTPGGPSPAVTGPAIEESRARLRADRSRLAADAEQLRKAEKALRDVAEAL